MTRSPYPFTTVFDGQVAHVVVKRFVRDESFAFRAKFGAFERQLSRLAKQADAAKTDEEIREAETAIEAHTLATEAFEDESVRRFVSLEPGHVVEGRPVATGDELLEAYGWNRAVMGELFKGLAAVNTYAEPAKNLWRKRHDSITTSAAASAERPGPRPGATAASALPEVSKRIADA